MRSLKDQFEQFAYVFQGGGALGAYQVGVFQALIEHGYEPTWLIGTSIGAINAGIIVGNKPEDRLPKLKEFWDSISTNMPGWIPKDMMNRRLYNYISAMTSLFYGQKDFFYPRLDLILTMFNSIPDHASFYVIDPLKETLKRLINFDLLNSGTVRYTLGAVEISQGMPIYFDNTKQTIYPEHILASCALPPGFPPVEIDEKYYWDGGVMSNSPTEVLISEPHLPSTLCFMANLFDSYGLNPHSLDDVCKRYKDIMYSSRYRSQIQSYRETLKLQNAIHALYNKLPNDLKNDPSIKQIYDEVGDNISSIHFVRFLYTAPSTELSSKDFEFSALSIEERLQAGYQDGLYAVKESPWASITSEKVAIHEICSHTTVLEKLDKTKQHPKQKHTFEWAEKEKV